MKWSGTVRNQFNAKVWVTFLSFVVLYGLSISYLNHFVLTKSLYYNSFGDQLSYSGIDELFSVKQRWQWLGLVLFPVVLLVKIACTSGALSIGCILTNNELSFRKIVRVALVAEICPAFGMVVRVILLTFLPLGSFADIQSFSPLSLAQLLGPQNIPKYLLYLCQTVNVFEMAYWVILAGGLVAFLKKPFRKMFKLVMSSYGLGLLLWVIFVSYLTVTFSP